VHYAARDANDEFTRPDEIINTEDEPDHQGLCDLEQAFFLNSIQKNADLSDHLEDAVNSLKIVLACDEAVRTGKTVAL
jgi:pyridoxal/pyridoxine/pyridoxamine kinase